jgi:hypothetical protein
MSHFAVVVLLPRLSETAMNSEIERLLEPYGERLEVDEYPHVCYCVGNIAKKHGSEMANKLVGRWDDRRESFKQSEDGKAFYTRLATAHAAENWDLYETISSEGNALYRAYNAEFDQNWEETKRDYTEYHSAFAQSEADCEKCNGTGFYASTYNQQSKWDWYRVGGRFDGLMTNTPQASDNGFNFDAKHETLANNSVSVFELLQAAEPFIPYALVTPEGEWIERGQMGWWGMSSGDKDRAAWNSQVKAIYEKFSKFDAVLLDCHI